MMSEDLIKRSDAIETAYQLRHKPNDAEWKEWLKSFNTIPSAEQKAVECSGCKCLGSYESDFPCVNCVRITKDYYCGADMRGGDDE